MEKSLFIIMVGLIAISAASAGGKRMVECRLVTPKTTECKPYPLKYMYTEKLQYGDNRQKLIISKTLPVPKRPKLIRVINVEDMLEEHLEILEPVRFSGSQPSPLLKTEEEKNLELAERERDKAEAEKEMKAELAALKKKKERLALEKKREREIKKKALSQKEKLKKSKKKKKLAKKKKEIKKKKKKRSKLAKKLEKKYLGLKKKRRGRALNEYDTKLFNVSSKGKHKLRVHATAYTSHKGQTDKTPFLAAWNNRLRPGMKIIAVSRDLIKKYGLGNGKKVKIEGLPGSYTVRDKMNKRFTKRIDIYMGTNRRKALRWGRRRTVIYW